MFIVVDSSATTKGRTQWVFLAARNRKTRPLCDLVTYGYYTTSLFATTSILLRWGGYSQALVIFTHLCVDLHRFLAFGVEFSESSIGCI